jgi:hypothetical protein
MKTSNQKLNKRYQSAATIQTSRLPLTLEQIRQRTHDIYVAGGGAEEKTLNDLLQAEQKIKRKLTS